MNPFFCDDCGEVLEEDYHCCNLTLCEQCADDHQEFEHEGDDDGWN